MREYDAEDLRRLRNEVPWPEMLKKLRSIHKVREGRMIFQCPQCGKMLTAVNARTNFGRCFLCKVCWNPIDFTIAIWELEFQCAVVVLEPLLPSRSMKERRMLPAPFLYSRSSATEFNLNPAIQIKSRHVDVQGNNRKSQNGCNMPGQIAMITAATPIMP